MDTEQPSSSDLHTDDSTDRNAMDVSETQPPKLGFAVVGIGASAGGLEAFIEFFDVMPPDKGMAFVLVQHLSPKRESMVAEILQQHTKMPVLQVEDGMPVEPDHVYVIRPGHTMTIKDGHLRLGDSLLKPGHSRPVDDFFRSLAEEQRERAVCIVLSGMGSNGTAGAQAVKVVGGVCIAQDPDSAKFPSMPRSLIDANLADFILHPQEMPEVLLQYSRHTYVSGNRSAEIIARREAQQIADILAILWTRIRHDFTGYKKPTIVRRIQRRMSLTQTATMADYAKQLRQAPSEVRNLADDLMIHVTGFFRDAEVWEALREKVILPMVGEKQDQSTIRCWVTACASGEEAYTLAMLLVEAAEQVDKRFDIKVFATDMAERALVHARAGIFPGGIESEISAERLNRFFDREDGIYRVKRDLRERVVFAPQNVLQDPPFSRLDIVTCRNLLIYLEQDVQQKLLGLLHFGLRENGTLVLGNSETIGDRDDLFEAIDKKARLYRRIGPTRHGLVDFPTPASMLRPLTEREPGEPNVVNRASLAQVANKLLLDTYTPPAVVVDRHGRIAFFHGPTEIYLDQPRGEPTRELLLLVHENVRGTVRVALNQAIESGIPAVVKDGTMTIDDTPYRIEVTAAPMDRRGVAGYFLISFNRYPISVLPVSVDGSADSADIAEELRGVRDELQSTIEELQTSNEELKASNEEVTSINEELQSTNEELETSKEELQSLNEELTTVNAQLQSKMEESERAGNDLSSLLSSTDIAVIFLDTQFRIRRYTPAIKRLMDLIPSDLGRPLADMARRFEDKRLLEDAASVLETLQPITTEILAGNGNWYTRRVLPYRTTDNRIEGVVITFVDISDRHNAEQVATEAKEFAESIVETLHEPLLVLRPDLTVARANKAFYTNFKVRPDETIGRMVYDLGNGQWNIPALRKLLEEVLPNDDVFNDYEVQHTFESIGPRTMLVNGRRLDHVQLILLGIRDITERKQAEQALDEAKVRFQSVANLVPDLLWSSRADGHTEWYNQRWAEYTGQTLEQAVGWGWAEVIHPDDREQSVRRYHEAVESGKTLVQEHRIRRHDGEYRWFLVRSEPVRDEAGNVTMFGSATDIHDQRTVLAALRESESVTRAVAELVPEMLWQVDPTGVPFWHNHRWTDYTGQTVKQAASGGWQKVVHPDDRDETNRTFAESLRTGQPWRHEHRIRNTNGEYRWFLVQGMPQRDEAGTITSWFGSVTDIHDQRLAVAEVSESESQLKSVMENARDFAIILMDEKGVITQWNAGATALMGWTDAEAIGQPGAMIYTPEDRAARAPETEAELALRDGRAPDERWHLRKDGSRFWGSGVLSLVLVDKGQRRGFVKVLRDTTDRQQVEDDRARLLEAEQHARAQAEAANAAKDQFLANASHELRTPLSAILLWANLLKTDDGDKRLRAEAIHVIEHSAKAQQKLIEDLLDSARIATGKLAVELKPADLTAAVRDAVATMRPAAEAKNLELVIDLGEDIGHVMIDPERLQQVVWNLVSNAVKFTPSGGRIDVGLTRQGDTVEIRVGDTGLGIAAEDLPHVFTRFRQGDPSITRRQSGLGLGLAISRQLVELHGGTIAVASEGKGRGSTFTIALPLPRQRPGKRAKATSQTEGGLEHAKLLLIEDDESTREVLKVMIRRAGATVEAFGHADLAKESFLASRPDLIVSDIGLPDKDGYTLIRELRAAESPDTKRVPAVALTAFDRPSDQERALAAGFDAYLTKPVETSRLLAVIRQLLGR